MPLESCAAPAQMALPVTSSWQAGLGCKNATAVLAVPAVTMLYRARVMLGYFPLLLWVAVLSVAVGVYDVTLVKVWGQLLQRFKVAELCVRNAGSTRGVHVAVVCRLFSSGG